ncbi:MAG: helix-turn-helix domain-containing protein [Marinosulfonomonas sp.]
MITGIQIRAARNALRWTTETLAEQSGITSRTVKRMESWDGVPKSNSQTLHNLQSALEAAGIEFIGAPDDCPGIRICPKPAKG